MCLNWRKQYIALQDSEAELSESCFDIWTDWRITSLGPDARKGLSYYRYIKPRPFYLLFDTSIPLHELSMCWVFSVLILISALFPKIKSRVYVWFLAVYSWMFVIQKSQFKLSNSLSHYFRNWVLDVKSMW